MADKKIFPVILLTVIFLFPVSVLCAQTDNSALQPGYHIDYSGNEPRFIQRLMWDKDEYALHYEIEIQLYSDRYTKHHIEIIKQNFINISLPPGMYRYSVTAFDLLGRRTETSDWMEFRVIAAFQPEIKRIAPAAFYMDQRLERILHIGGENIFLESVIYLKDGDKYIFPLKRNDISESRVSLIFDDEKLIPGNYSIIIENPGGLTCSYGGFIVGYRKALDIFLKLAAVPAIPLYGEMLDIFGSNLYLFNTAFGFEAVSSKRSTFNGGFEISTTVYMINPIFVPRFDMNEIAAAFMDAGTGAAFIDSDINMVLQKRLFNMKAAISFRFGGGITLMLGYGEFARNEFIIHLNTNLTFMLLFFDTFYFEVGADCSFYTSNVPFGLIKPRLGFVWQF